MSAGLCGLIRVCSVFYEGSNIETNSRTLFSSSLHKFSPPEVVLSSSVSGRPRTHAYEQGDGQLKHPSLVSFEYELPSALRQLLLRRAGFLILNLQIIHDLRHVGHPSCHFLGARALVFRVDFRSEEHTS